MANDPIDAPALWEYPSGPCGRPTKIGTLCPAGRAAASVYAGGPDGFGSPRRARRTSPPKNTRRVK